MIPLCSRALKYHNYKNHVLNTKQCSMVAIDSVPLCMHQCIMFHALSIIVLNAVRQIIQNIRYHWQIHSFETTSNRCWLSFNTIQHAMHLHYIHSESLRVVCRCWVTSVLCFCFVKYPWHIDNRQLLHAVHVLMYNK